MVHIPISFDKGDKGALTPKSFANIVGLIEELALWYNYVKLQVLRMLLMS